MTRELPTQAVYLGLPINNVGAFELSMRKYGIQSVSSLLTGSLAYALSFGGIFSTSVSANYHQYAVTNYVKGNAYSIDLGALIKMGEMVNV